MDKFKLCPFCCSPDLGQTHMDVCYGYNLGQLEKCSENDNLGYYKKFKSILDPDVKYKKKKIDKLEKYVNEKILRGEYNDKYGVYGRLIAQYPNFSEYSKFDVLRTLYYVHGYQTIHGSSYKTNPDYAFNCDFNDPRMKLRKLDSSCVLL